ADVGLRESAGGGPAAAAAAHPGDRGGVGGPDATGPRTAPAAGSPPLTPAAPPGGAPPGQRPHPGGPQLRGRPGPAGRGAGPVRAAAVERPAVAELDGRELLLREGRGVRRPEAAADAGTAAVRRRRRRGPGAGPQPGPGPARPARAGLQPPDAGGPAGAPGERCPLPGPDAAHQ